MILRGIGDDASALRRQRPDAIFCVDRNPPKTEKDWNDLQAQALILAESGNLLMMGRRARDQGEWIKEGQEMVEVGAAAYKAALAQDLPQSEPGRRLPRLSPAIPGELRKAEDNA